MQTRLKDGDGKTVNTEERASTFATYLEKIQWHVRHVTVVPDPDPPHMVHLTSMRDFSRRGSCREQFARWPVVKAVAKVTSA